MDFGIIYFGYVFKLIGIENYKNIYVKLWNEEVGGGCLFFENVLMCVLLEVNGDFKFFGYIVEREFSECED